jgi:branched-chain amino acid transport system substrate-binding protein
MRFRRNGIVAVAALAGLLAAGCGSSSSSSTAATTATTAAGGTATTAAGGTATTAAGGTATNTASAPGITKDTIKIGFITSVTGNAGSTFSDSATGAKARFDAINAAGGINGRKIQVIDVDDTSTAAGDVTATQDLLNKGVFLIENYSPYAYGGYRVAQAAGVPVTGGGFDGPEWGTKPNTNMFSYLGGTNGRTSNNTETANFFKFVGATNVAGLAYGISPSSTGSIQDLKTALGKDGLKMGYENLSVPFGGVDLTSYILAMKQANVDGAGCSCVQSTNLAMFTGLRQAGLNNVKALSFSAADSSVFDNPTAAAAAQGAYYPTLIPPLDLNNAATTTFLANLKAVDPGYKGGYPSFGLTGAYLGADVAIKGLQVAGQNPTRASFISALTQVTGYTAGGLLASPVSFNHFGTSEPMSCAYYVQVAGNTFKTINNGKPICGTSF